MITKLIEDMQKRNAKKSEYLSKARYYYNMYNKELEDNGYTIKAEHYIYECIQLYKYYYDNGGRVKIDYDNYIYLYNYYYDILQFTPTNEDIDEMKYWIY